MMTDDVLRKIRQREAARRRRHPHIVAGVDLQKALDAYRQLPPFKGNLGRRKITLNVGHSTLRGTAGRAFIRTRRIRIVAGYDTTPEAALEVLVHELVHIACPNHHHGERFRRLLRRAFLELWGIDVPLEVPPLQGVVAYGMDAIAVEKLKEKIALGEIDLFPPDPKRAPSKPMAKVVEKRAAHAIAMHKKAITRLKRAKTIERRWRQKAAYYERQAAKRGNS